MKQEEDKCCGDCCWFCFEMTDGCGHCVNVGNDGYPMMMTSCNSKSCSKFVSRAEMRHHMAVLLLHTRWVQDEYNIRKAPCGDEVDKAIEFSYKYMKVFSKL